MLDQARAATGLDDFGDERFLGAFRVLLRAYDEEAQLTPFGRMMVNQELAGILASRLSAEAAWRRRPEVLDVPLRAPIFILGLPRSGTTALHQLLAQDPENQVLEYWLGAAPQPRPPRSAWEKDPGFRASARGLRMVYYLDPGLKAIHHLTADGPDECRHLFLQSFLDHTFDHNATIPSYTKYFEQQDMRPAYTRHRDLLKLIGAPQPERRWVLKYPAHLLHLDVLFETYPDACIVQTHRDPSRVLPSVCSLVTSWRGLYEDDVDPLSVGSWQLDFLSGMMTTAMQARERLRPESFFDLHFHELLRDPISSIRAIYSRFGRELSPEAEARMRAWHEGNPQGRHGGHTYTSEQFGLAPEQIFERLQSYMDRFGVRRERAV